jgi:hypothetical protein
MNRGHLTVSLRSNEVHTEISVTRWHFIIVFAHEQRTLNSKFETNEVHTEISVTECHLIMIFPHQLRTLNSEFGTLGSNTKIGQSRRCRGPVHT